MTPKPPPSPADRLRDELALCENRGWHTAELPISVASALLSDHARLVEEIGRLREAISLTIDDPMCVGRTSTQEYFRDTGSSRKALVRLRAALSPSQKEGAND